ncbi:glycosyltransferase [Marinobacter sp.]|uniref:glycosyltransferase n=1 Tax=Marinobacter sp. TaxID=50741 RepID=UPI003A95D24C
MRILYLITGLGVGGAERVVTSLADEMAARGHTVMIAYLVGPALVTPRNKKVAIEALKLESMRRFVPSFIAFIKLTREFKPDVIHSHMVHANILARLARPFCSVKRLVCTAHSNNEGGKSRMLAYRLTGFLADVTTNVSQDAVRAFEERGAANKGVMLAIHNGVCTDRFQYNEVARDELRREFSIAEGQACILAVGRLYDEKDYPTLFHALIKLTGANNNYHLIIAGDGPARGQLVELASELCLQDKITFAGVRSDIYRLMSAADVFVLSSAWEGFGLVVAEAMACERVVVATDCGGVAEVLGECGYLVPPESPEELSDALGDACALSESERESIGQRARQRVMDHYSLVASADKWEALYQ